MTDRSKCVILMPVSSHIEWSTGACLDKLSENGYVVNKVMGCANVDIARAMLASKALKEGYEELFWIDSDIEFDLDDVERLRSHDLPIVCGIYPKKWAEGGVAAILKNGTGKLVFGEFGGLVEIRWAGTGFLYTKRVVYEDIKSKLKLPDCDLDCEHPITPYFMPFTIPGRGNHHYYLGDDTSFCERARQCGYSIYADTTVRLGHIGKYNYSWEDVGGPRERYSSMVCEITRKSIESP